MNKTALAVEFSLHSPSEEHIAAGPANPGALGSAHPPVCLPSSLTVLQRGDRFGLRTEVTVSDVVGGFHSQFVRGERVQAGECKKNKAEG